jgi:hypothetical protein
MAGPGIWKLSFGSGVQNSGFRNWESEGNPSSSSSGDSFSFLNFVSGFILVRLGVG